MYWYPMINKDCWICAWVFGLVKPWNWSSLWLGYAWCQIFLHVFLAKDEKRVWLYAETAVLWCWFWLIWQMCFRKWWNQDTVMMYECFSTWGRWKSINAKNDVWLAMPGLRLVEVDFKVTALSTKNTAVLTQFSLLLPACLTLTYFTSTAHMRDCDMSWGKRTIGPVWFFSPDSSRKTMSYGLSKRMELVSQSEGDTRSYDFYLSSEPRQDQNIALEKHYWEYPV